MKFILIFLCLLSIVEAKKKPKTYGDVIVDKVVSVYDGDTFRVNIKSYPDIVGKRIAIRLNGVDTPEIRGKCKEEKQLAKKAKSVVKTRLKRAKQIELRNMQRGKYFRIVADVYVDGKSLANILLEKKLAVRYSGSTKVKDWCTE
jgi:endonuclease YncB( thermonuclease family)